MGEHVGVLHINRSSPNPTSAPWGSLRLYVDMRLHMYVYIYNIYIYICIYVFARGQLFYIQTFIKQEWTSSELCYRRACTFSLSPSHMYICPCSSCVCMYVCRHVCVHVCLYIYTHACMYMSTVHLRLVSV